MLKTGWFHRKIRTHALALDRKSGNLWFILGALLIAVSLALRWAAQKFPVFVEWYAESVYPAIVGVGGRMWGLFPFSVLEILVCVLSVIVIWSVVKGFRRPVVLLKKAVFLAGFLFFLFMANCGVNYYRLPFSRFLGMEVRESSVEELTDLCLSLTEEVNRLRAETDKGVSQPELRRYSVEAMDQLGQRYPQLSGYYPSPKPMIFSYALSIQQLCGFYSPFTVEANYNRNMPDYNIPHTLCHELSHLKGFMREDEANFIGYLACIGSDSRVLQYSGYLTGWVYAANELAKIDIESYRQLFGQLSPAVVQDLAENSRFWTRYDGKVAEVSNKINDAYLKINDQTDGVRSYGRVVDLMLAYRRTFP